MRGLRAATLFLLALSLIAFLSVVASFNVITLSLEEEPIGSIDPISWLRSKLVTGKKLHGPYQKLID